MDKDEMIKDYRERYAKWEGIRREQLSLANNLLLTFSVAILGFSAKQYQGLFGNNLLLWGCVFIMISIFAGIGLIFSRLYDYKYTSKRLRLKIKYHTGIAISEKDNVILKKAIDNNIDIDKWVGKLTWIFLWGQLITFLAGCYFLMFFIFGLPVMVEH